MAHSREDDGKRPAPRPAKRSAGEKRIVAEVPEAVHRQVRIRCFERGILMRDYILELLAKDGIT